jgi:sulfur-oxidizing protein SoxZ
MTPDRPPVRSLVQAPKIAARGDIIEIRAIIAHHMETGDIIRRFECRYNGVEIFSADLHPSIAANPLISFHTVATESGRLQCRWIGDNGLLVNNEVEIVVS